MGRRKGGKDGGREGEERQGGEREGGEREGGEKVREGEEREKTDGQCVLLSTVGLLSQCLLRDHPQSSYLCETMFSTMVVIFVSVVLPGNHRCSANVD